MWKEFGGIHPFLVHFPVALVITTVVAETLYVLRREPRFGTAARFMVVAGAWAALPAMVAGFAAASGEGFDGELARAFSFHRIAGVATPMLTVLAAGLAESSRRTGQIWELMLFRIFLAAALLSVVISGIYGDILVRG